MSKAVDKISKFQKFGSILTLDRISVLLDKLGNPQDHLSVIHVTGTNGKGSVSRFIYEALRENGYKTGIYTSPFIEVFNERIEFDGKYISDNDLQKYTDIVVSKADEMTSEGADSPTEFEIITAIGFLYFKEKGADFVVLEVGLGGIGDSTNVVKKPLASVITSISIDHTKELGPSVFDIAREKAGIIKKGVPVISGVKDEKVQKILIDKCKEVNELSHEDLFYESSKVAIRKNILSLDYYEFSGDFTKVLKDDLDANKTHETYKISMIGTHQIENAACAITTLKVLEKNKNIKLNEEKTKSGIMKAKQKCRFEVMKDCRLDLGGEEIDVPVVVLDGAHNEDGAKKLVETIKTHFSDKKVMMLVGFLADKKVREMLCEFVKVTNEFVLTEPDSIRKLSVDKLEAMFDNQNFGLLDEKNEDSLSQSFILLNEKNEDSLSQSFVLHAEKNRKRAFKQAFRIVKEKGYDALVMAGSFYLMGEARTFIKDNI